jgi:hypothetical protein
MQQLNVEYPHRWPNLRFNSLFPAEDVRLNKNSSAAKESNLFSARRDREATCLQFAQKKFPE